MSGPRQRPLADSARQRATLQELRAASARPPRWRRRWPAPERSPEERQAELENVLGRLRAFIERRERGEAA